jgi:hypothetical protein
MTSGQFDTVYGFITQEKYVRNKSLGELERLLGFRTGRLSKGAKIYYLTQLPGTEQFHFRGYSQVAGDKYEKEYGKASVVDRPAQGESEKDFRERVLRIKKHIIQTVWAETGPDRLVKISANIRHTQEETYPPGLGIPQWELAAGMPARLIAEINDYPNGVFRSL